MKIEGLVDEKTARIAKAFRAGLYKIPTLR